KQLAEVENFVNKLPTPDPAEEWTHDPNSGLLKSPASESLRTAKEPAVFVKYEATKEHPAQTEFFMKDVAVGTWRQGLYSAGIQADRKTAMLAGEKRLQAAAKLARAQATLTEVEGQRAGEAILGFLFSWRGRGMPRPPPACPAGEAVHRIETRWHRRSATA